MMMPVVRLVEGTSRAELVREYGVAVFGKIIIVPEGFQTDWASVPRVFWRLYPPWGPWAPAALVHDWLYFCGDVPRAFADRVFRELIKRLGEPWWTQWIMYLGVRLGGWHAWNQHRRREAAKGD